MLTATLMSARLYLMQRVAGEADIAFGDFDQGDGERLDQHVVDRQLDAAAGETGINLAAQLEQASSWISTVR